MNTQSSSEKMSTLYISRARRNRYNLSGGQFATHLLTLRGKGSSSTTILGGRLSMSTGYLCMRQERRACEEMPPELRLKLMVKKCLVSLLQKVLSIYLQQGKYTKTFSPGLQQALSLLQLFFFFNVP